MDLETAFEVCDELNDANPYKWNNSRTAPRYRPIHQQPMGAPVIAMRNMEGKIAFLYTVDTIHNKLSHPSRSIRISEDVWDDWGIRQVWLDGWAPIILVKLGPLLKLWHQGSVF